jgi:nicotinamidase-related amidase
MTIGLQTDYCIDATVKSGFERGFRMIVPAFCNTTEDNDFLTGESSYRYYNEQMWRDRYASCISLEDAKNLLS